jgi:hypothetical protein
MNYSNIRSLKTGIAVFLLIIGFTLQSCNSTDKKEGAQTEVKAPRQTLFEATFLGKLDLVKQHIAAGTDLNQKDDYGSTALNIATTFGKTDIALALIAGGADIESKSGDGSTALHSAAFFARTEIVKSLLAKGADVNARNNYNATALESVLVPFDQMKPVYDQMARDLGPLGLKLDYARISEAREVIASMISSQQ